MATSIDIDSMHAAAGDAAQLMKALANPDRLLILCRLSQGELSVGQLESELGILQPTLSQQLTVLREQSLVGTRREGKHVFYSVRSRQVLAVLKFCSREAGR
jgi:DNA-binding transcriptional ArsR family regulator